MGEENLSTDEKPKKGPNYDFKVDLVGDGLFIERNEAERSTDENGTLCIDELQTSDLAVSPDLSDSEKDLAGDYDDSNAGVNISGSSEDKVCRQHCKFKRRNEP